VDGRTYGRTDVRTDGRTDGRTDVRTYVRTDGRTYMYIWTDGQTSRPALLGRLGGADVKINGTQLK